MFSACKIAGNIESGKILYSKLYITPEEEFIEKFISMDNVSLKKDSIEIVNDGKISLDYLRRKAQGDTIKMAFEIYPKYFFTPVYLTDKFSNNGYKTTRDSLYSYFTNRNSKNERKINKVEIFKNKEYKIDFLRDQRKIIKGYECFKIVAFHKENNRYYEMFVTEKIKLNYNPVINIELVTDRFFPLQVFMRNTNNSTYAKYEVYSIDIERRK